MKSSGNEVKRAKLSVFCLLLSLGFSQSLLVSSDTKSGIVAGILAVSFWLSFAWNLNPIAKDRLTRLLLPSIVIFVIRLSSWLAHTEGYFGWSETLAKSLFLSLLWLSDILRRRCSDLEATLASRLFGLTQFGSILSLIFVFTYRVPLPPWPGYVALSTMASIVISSIVFICSRTD